MGRPRSPHIHDLWTARLPTAAGGALALAEVLVSAHVSAPHAHPGFSLIWTATGWDWLDCGAFHGPVAAGSVVLIGAGVIHADRAGTAAPAHSLALYFPPDDAVTQPLAPKQVVAEATAVPRLASLIRNVAKQARGGRNSDAALVAVVQELSRHCARTASVANGPAPSAPPRGQSRAAHLRAFTRANGCTPGQYDRQHRVRLAAGLLLAGASPAAAAADAGFCDQSHLHRHFLRQFGVTPAEFAERNSVQDGRTLDV